MNTNFTIKNFRVFDENGVTIDIKPMTILTGCNSSGKSSIVKAAFLLNDFMKQVHNAIEKGEELQLSKYKIDFTTYPNNLLGRFDKVIPEVSSSKKVTLGYTIHSCLIFKDVDVQLIFVNDSNDELNNAYLESITISTEDGIFYSSDKENGNRFNLNVISQYLPIYANIDNLVNELDNLITIYYNFDMSEDDYNNQKDIIISQLQKYNKQKFEDVVRYNQFKKKESNNTKKENLEIIE